MPGQTNNPDLLSAVNQIIVVLNEISGQLPELANKCCNCSGVNYPSFIDPAPATPPTGETPPTGFDTWQAYSNYKCNVANWIFEGIQGFFSQVANTLETGIGYGSYIGFTPAVEILAAIFRNWRATAPAALAGGAPLTGTVAN